MGKTAEEVLQAVLSKTLNIDETGVTALKEADGSFKDEAIDKLLSLDQARVAAWQTETDQKVSAKASTVKREEWESMEAAVREVTGYKDTSKKGMDLIKAAVVEKINAAGSITDDKVKASPLYLELERKVSEFPGTLEAKLKEQETTLQARYKGELMTDRVVARAINEFKAMNPILPKNEAVAKAQMKLLEDYVRKHKFDVTEKDGEITDIVPMNSDGSARLEDSHKKHIPWNQFLADGARQFFEFHEGEAKGGAPNPYGTGSSSGGAGGGGSKGTIRTMEDYAKRHAEARQLPTYKEREAAYAALKTEAQEAGVLPK